MADLNITDGCFVRLQNGEERGPLRSTENGAWRHGSTAWDKKGRFLNYASRLYDIVEVIAEPQPKGLPSVPFGVPMPPVKPPRAEELRRRVIYLSGPMKGLPDHNVPAFNRAAATLRALGHEVMNPGEHQDDARCDLKPVFMRYCDFIINKADMLVILPGWENSKGVAAEKALAEVFNLEIRYL